MCRGIIINKFISFKIPDHINMIIDGDSYTARAIDDEIFLHAINISDPGTPYLYSYIKLKKFIKNNPQINKVLLSFHAGSVASGRNSWYLDQKWLLQSVPNYLFLFSMEETAFFMKINFKNFGLAIATLPKTTIYNVIKSTIIDKTRISFKDLGIGGYSKLETANIDEHTKIMETNDNTNNVYKTSEYEQVYLSKIIELCRENNIELIFISTPTYHSEKYTNKTQFMSFYFKFYSEIKYLDYSDFSLPVHGYYDIGHLNSTGAEIFSRYLQDNYESIFEYR